MLLLSNKDIINIKHNTIGFLNKLDIISLCKEIDTYENLKIYTNSTDIKYKITQCGKDIEKTETVIIITTDKMRENHNNKNINNFL